MLPGAGLKPTIIGVATFVLGTLLGSGSIWQWKNSELDARKQQIEGVQKLTELRKQENDLYRDIIELSDEYITAADQYSKAPTQALNRQIHQLSARLDVIKDDFRTLEGNLSRLEGRAPRTIPLDFVPPGAPSGLTVTAR